jgi:hypothetical protein
VLEIDQHLQGVADDLMGALALYVYDEADAAGVMFGGGIVQTSIARRICCEHGRHILPPPAP